MTSSIFSFFQASFRDAGFAISVASDSLKTAISLNLLALNVRRDVVALSIIASASSGGFPSVAPKDRISVIFE